MSVPCGNFPSNVIIRPFFLLAFFLVLFLAFTLEAFRSLHASETQEQTELLLSACFAGGPLASANLVAKCQIMSVNLPAGAEPGRAARANISQIEWRQEAGQ